MTKDLKYIPDVFVIGSMKSGTSTLWKNIKRQNVDIKTTKDKEVDLFLHDYPVSLINQFYARQFDRPDTLKIDFSPNYSRSHVFKKVAAKIYEANPKAKIVYIVREPIARILSHLHHDMFRDRVPLNNYESYIFNPGNDYIASTKYYNEISQYTGYFGRQQVLVLSFEQLISKKETFYSQLTHFLGCDPIKPHKKGYNLSDKRYLIKFYDKFYRHIKNPSIRKLYNYLWYIINIKVHKPTLTNEARHRIVEILKPDAIKLSNDFGIDISTWFK